VLARTIAVGFVVSLLGGGVANARGDDARILFASTRPVAEIHVMHADGSGKMRVTHRAPAGSGAAWSPDGARIAFNGSSGSAVQLWVMDRAGGNIRPLGFSSSTSAGIPFPDPDWAPGGRRIVLSYGEDIFIVNRDGTGRRRLTRGGDEEWSPAWSPNGAWIAFTRAPQIWRMRTDGSAQQALGRGDEADWSPNGKRIVFTIEGPRGRDIYSMRADGTDRRRLTSTPGDEGAPSWSPGGARIAYSRGFNGSVWVMDADGRNKRLVITNAAAPSWSPRGSFLAFTRIRVVELPNEDPRDVPAIFARRADGVGAATRLLTPEFDEDVEASPDGTKIAYTSVRPYSSSGIYVADVDGANETFIHPGRGPDWSPDGTRILLWHDGALYLVDEDGSNPTQLPEPEGHALAFPMSGKWHPDGRVAFISLGVTDCADVYAMNLAGTNVARMTRSDCLPHVVDFDWDPTGGALVFTGFRCELFDCDPQIFRAQVPDGAPVVLATAFPFLFHPRVSPEGTKVAFVRSGDFGETAVWSMNIDGSGKTQLTPMGTGTAPVWLPAP
jgi:Tol biopolymer transport system component